MEWWSKPSAISTAQLNRLPGLHLPPIKRVVFPRPYSAEADGRPHLEEGFALRCFQRLSRPDMATGLSAPGRTNHTPAVRLLRSSRTNGTSPPVSCAPCA